MSVNKRIGYGMTLGCDPNGGTSYTTLGAIVDGLKDGDAKADTADTTLLADTYKTKSKGQVDPGEASFTIAYDPDEATSTTLATLLGTASATPPTWIVTLPAGTLGSGSITTKTFAGHLTGMGREIMKDKMITCNITITKTGNPGM